MAAESFAGLVTRVTKKVKTKNDIVAKLIMLGFTEENIEFNLENNRDFKLDLHFIRLNVFNNTYSQRYDLISIASHWEINDKTISRVIQQMEIYDKSASNK